MNPNTRTVINDPPLFFFCRDTKITKYVFCMVINLLVYTLTPGGPNCFFFTAHCLLRGADFACFRFIPTKKNLRKLCCLTILFFFSFPFPLFFMQTFFFINFLNVGLQPFIFHFHQQISTLFLTFLLILKSRISAETLILIYILS